MLVDADKVKEKLARLCEKRAEARFDEHGTREPDTNATYYGGSRGDELAAMDEEDDDIAAAIRQTDLLDCMVEPEAKPVAVEQIAQIKREYEAQVTELQQQFRRETLRTSELTQMIIKFVEHHQTEHEPGPWSRSCSLCALVMEAKALLIKPVNIDSAKEGK